MVISRPFAVLILLALTSAAWATAGAATGASTGASTGLDVAATADLDWAGMAMALIGGLALFLYGLELLTESLKAVAGDRMKGILAGLTANRFAAALTGALVTAVIQSSSVTTVLVVGFVSAGIMTLAQSVGVIMGANLGTTITAQIVAFKITEAAYLFVAIGFAMSFLTRRENVRRYGFALLGLGLIFLGMNLMGDAMRPLRGYPPFLDSMQQMESPAYGILAGAIFTALVQSSSASTGIVIVMASQGFVTLPAGIAILFGANIGTCVTALLATLGRNREAIRAALVHLIFNFAGVVVWLAFIPQLTEAVALLSPAHAELAGAERLAAEVPRQIANAHTLFNLANVLIFIGLTPLFARLVTRMVPDDPGQDALLSRPKYLDDSLLSAPALALDRVRMEVVRMGELVQGMLDRILPAIMGNDREELERINRADEPVDRLFAEILDYLGKIGSEALSEAQSAEYTRLMRAISDLESIGDVIETNMVALGRERIAGEIPISAAAETVIQEFQHLVSAAVRTAVQAVSQNNPEAARRVIILKSEIARLSDSAAVHQARRLSSREPNRIAAYALERDILEKQKRIYYLAKRMAKMVLPDNDA